MYSFAGSQTQNPRVLDMTCLLLASYCVFKIISKRRTRRPLPPGPKGYPIVGNLFDLPAPTSQAWRTYAQWGVKYGGISSVGAFGQTIIVINDQDIVHQLLDARGQIYSGRPRTTMLKLTGIVKMTPMQPFRNEVKRHRKLITQAVGTAQGVKKLQPLLEYHSCMLLRHLLKAHCGLFEVLHKSIGATLMSLTYGYPVEDNENAKELLLAAERIVDIFNEVAAPGRFIVDAFPWLQRLPRWFPGCEGFTSIAEECQGVLNKMINVPLNFVLTGKNDNPPSFVSDALAHSSHEDEVRSIGVAAWNFYGAGIHPLKSGTSNYILAMIHYPHVQEKVHKEIDLVIGRDRLPTYEDRDSLPYLQAVLKESLRWLPASPTNIARGTSCDDVYNGYFIPKLSSIHGMQFLHDPVTYKDPFTFNPDRFLGPNPERDPSFYAFGYGRRMCPGMHLGDAIIWAFIAKLAAGFWISAAIGEDGNEIRAIVDQTFGTVTTPVPFECKTEQRHDKVSLLVDEGVKNGTLYAGTHTV